MVKEMASRTRILELAKYLNGDGWTEPAEILIKSISLLDELEAAREALSQIYWKSIDLGEDRGDSTINHIAADALKGDTSPLDARDRRMKLIGAAEWLEREVEIAKAAGRELITYQLEYFTQRAAQLRREAEEK